jgi:hypothetical protein
VEDVDSPTVIAFPRPGVALDPLDDAGAAALAEIDAAIAMVAGGAARRVRLTAVPFVELAAAEGLAHARAVGVGFRFERPERAGVTVTIGPLDPSLVARDG